jgi:hypothetical protein
MSNDILARRAVEVAKLVREHDKAVARAEKAEAELAAIRDPNCKIRKREWFDEELAKGLEVVNELREERDELLSIVKIAERWVDTDDPVDEIRAANDLIDAVHARKEGQA